MARLHLPDVTLCSAASVNVAATIAALSRSLDLVEFGDCVLFTHQVPPEMDPRIRLERISPLRSAKEYSFFILRDLVGHLRTSHILICQWDGFIINPEAWTDDFLSYDYVGAVWPQFSDTQVVGNGGFSLRTRKLLEACRNQAFVMQHPEDVAICRSNRNLLEGDLGCRFAEPVIAAGFSFERQQPPRPTFGFHGVFNMIPLLGRANFWQTYGSLDDRRTLWTDYWMLMGQLAGGASSWPRAARMTLDRILEVVRDGRGALPEGPTKLKTQR
jgi:hypothetical protein